jgi:hypothetical protein
MQNDTDRIVSWLEERLLDVRVYDLCSKWVMKNAELDNLDTELLATIRCIEQSVLMSSKRSCRLLPSERRADLQITQTELKSAF